MRHLAYKKVIPENWTVENLEKVAHIHDELRRPINSSERADRRGPYPYYGACGQVGWIDDFRQDGDYILVGEDGAPFFDLSKDVAYEVSGKCWVNNHAHVLKAKEGLLLNKFLLHALNHTDYRGYANGTTRLKLTQAAMRKIPIPVPPIEEQAQICNKLDELFSDLKQATDTLVSASAQISILRQSILKSFFDSDKFPSTYRKLKLDQIGKLHCGQSPSVSQVNTLGKGHPYVTGPEQWHDQKIVESKWTEFPRRLVPNGCIFITVKGAGVGKLFPGIACAIGRDVYAYEPNTDICFQYVINALRYGINKVILKAQGDIPGLSKKHILDHEIYVPNFESQLAISDEIDKKFKALDEMESVISKTLSDSLIFKKSILDKALSGGLKI